MAKKFIALVLVILMSISVFTIAFAESDCGDTSNIVIENDLLGVWLTPDTKATLTYADGTKKGTIGSIFGCDQKDVWFHDWARYSWIHAAVVEAWETKYVFEFNLEDGRVAKLYFDSSKANTATFQIGKKTIKTRKLKDTLNSFEQEEMIPFLEKELDYTLPEDLICPKGNVSVSKLLLIMTTLSYDHNVATAVVRYSIKHQCEPILFDMIKVDYIDEDGNDATLLDGAMESFFEYETDRMINEVDYLIFAETRNIDVATLISEGKDADFPQWKLQPSSRINYDFFAPKN